jgi:2-polyprenyl-3-methyl-5-hydroxy-6-metoxy-1,4-benzoquinol methylase
MELLDSCSPLLVGPWDANVDFRADELANGRDTAYARLTSLVLDHLARNVRAGGIVLDAGCGLGYVSNSIVSAGYRVEGIDCSQQSISHARKKFSAIIFRTSAIEDFASHPQSQVRYDAVVANMVLHATPRISSFMESVRRVLKPGGTVIATIPHPRFFLLRKKLAPATFNDSDRIALFIPFRICGGRTHPEAVPYFQRPLQDYGDEMRRSGLTDVRLRPAKVGDDQHSLLVLSARRPSGE